MPKFRLVIDIKTDRIISFTEDEKVILPTDKDTAQATFVGEIPNNLTKDNSYSFVFRAKNILFMSLEEELNEYKIAVKKALRLAMNKKLSTFINTEQEMEQFLEGYGFLNGNISSTALIKEFSINNNVSYLTAATFFVDKNSLKTALIIDLENHVSSKEKEIDNCKDQEVLNTLQLSIATEFDLFKVQTLTLTPGWLNSKDYRFVQEFESNYETIKQEAIDLYNRGLFINHDISDESESKRSKIANKWKVFFIAYPAKVSDPSLAPFTRSLLNRYPEIINRPDSQIYFSLIPSGGIVRPHTKSSREFTRARHQLCLTMSKDATLENTFLRVSGEKRTWQEGKILTFDDGYIHDVQNMSSDSRLILLFDSNIISFKQDYVIN